MQRYPITGSGPSAPPEVMPTPDRREPTGPVGQPVSPPRQSGAPDPLVQLVFGTVAKVTTLLAIGMVRVLLGLFGLCALVYILTRPGGWTITWQVLLLLVVGMFTIGTACDTGRWFFPLKHRGKDKTTDYRTYSDCQERFMRCGTNGAIVAALIGTGMIVLLVRYLGWSPLSWWQYGFLGLLVSVVGGPIGGLVAYTRCKHPWQDADGNWRQ